MNPRLFQAGDTELADTFACSIEQRQPGFIPVARDDTDNLPFVILSVDEGLNTTQTLSSLVVSGDEMRLQPIAKLITAPSGK